MKIGDKYRLFKGRSIGMGTLREDVTGEIVNIQKTGDGKTMLTIKFRTSKDKRDRFAYELVDPFFVLREHFPSRDILTADTPIELIQKLDTHYASLDDAGKDHFWGGDTYIYVNGQEFNPADVITGLYYFARDYDYYALSFAMYNWYKPGLMERNSDDIFRESRDFRESRYVYRELCEQFNEVCDLPDETEDDE